MTTYTDNERAVVAQLNTAAVRIWRVGQGADPLRVAAGLPTERPPA